MTCFLARDEKELEFKHMQDELREFKKAEEVDNISKEVTKLEELRHEINNLEKRRLLQLDQHLS